MAARIIFAYVVCKNKTAAKKIGNLLLRHKLAACVNIFSNMNSLYWWKGKIVAANESVLIAKTTRTLFPKLLDSVRLAHSYKVPCILQLPITTGNKEYLDWMEQCLQ